SGRHFDPMQVGVSPAFFVADGPDEKETALERRLQNRVRQLRLATRPDGTVHGGPDRAIGDPRTVNIRSALYAVPKRLRSSSRACALSAPVTSSSTGVAQAVASGAARASDASPPR